MLTDKKRKMYLFVISFCMNLTFFMTAHFARLPVWLDTTGTVYISLLLSFPAGLLIGLLNNVILSAGFYGFNSIFYYIISVATALVTSMRIKRIKAVNLKLVLSLIVSLFLVSIILAIPLTLVLDDGIPADYWGQYLYNILITNDVADIISTILSVSIIKFFDIIVTVAIVNIAYYLTPQRFRDSKTIVMINYNRRQESANQL